MSDKPKDFSLLIESKLNSNTLVAVSSCLTNPDTLLASSRNNTTNTSSSSALFQEKEQNFTLNNILTSRHHPFTKNNKSSYLSYFYTNTNTILNRFVMSYEEQLHRAICKGNFELCSLLLLKNCDINKECNRKYPLCFACENNYYEIAELFINNGANVNQLDLYDQSPLVYAVDVADLSLIQLLITNGADVNICDTNGVHPLHVAINRQNDEICDYLLNAGALINAIDKQGCTPLSLSISNDYLYMIIKLLELGADPNITDNNGDTPLIKAIWSTMSTNVDNEQITKIVKCLIQYGADINAKNETGRTALFTAIYQNNTEIALYLIESGAKCELEDRLMSNFTLLHYACFQGNYMLVKALLNKKCNPNALSTSCESPCYIAVTKGYVDIVSLLVENGCDVNTLIGSDCDSKSTVLQASVFYLSDYDRFKAIADKLIEGNADLNIPIPGPILYICLQYNKIKFAKLLLSRGTSVNQRTICNQSCFYKAFLIRNYEFMQMCIMAGFNLYKNEPWIKSFLNNPNLAGTPNYFINRRSNSQISELVNSENDDFNNRNSDSDSEKYTIMVKTDKEIAEMLSLDEYFLERYHSKNQKLKEDKQKSLELTKRIYTLIRHHYTNPLSLQELARIQIRKSLLSIDNKIKTKIENGLDVPKRLKGYLLFEEFNL